MMTLPPGITGEYVLAVSQLQRPGSLFHVFARNELAVLVSIAGRRSEWTPTLDELLASLPSPLLFATVARPEVARIYDVECSTGMPVIVPQARVRELLPRGDRAAARSIAARAAYEYWPEWREVADSAAHPVVPGRLIVGQEPQRGEG